MKQYLAIFIILLITIAWVYFTDPRYTKPILAALPAFLIILANSFYESRVIFLTAIMATFLWGGALFYYWRINALPSPYEIYLIYLFLLMMSIVSFPLVRRTRKMFIQLEEEKNKTQAIITHLADGLLFFDRDNRLFLANPKAQEFFNVDFNQMMGLSLSKLLKFPQFKSLRRLFRKGIKKVFRKEISFGNNLVLEVSTIPIKKEKETIGGLIILHDITREKTIERMKTEFVSASAHQLRTPLSAIKWALKMLLEGDLGRVTLKQKEILQKAYKSNEKMLELINDLLNLSRIEEGRYLGKLKSCQLQEIISEIISSYQDKIQAKKIRFEFKKPKKKLKKINVDPEKIKLAIENLIDNSIKYTPKGGKITIDLKEKENKIYFKIEDTGIGIPKQQQKKVFSKFFRATNIREIDTEGTGLGLFITKNIIEAHKGRIWFKSEEGKGTTFYFLLPKSS